MITFNQSISNLLALPTDSQLSVAPAGQNGPLATDRYGNHIEFGPVPGATTGNFPQQTFQVSLPFLTQLFLNDIYTNVESYFAKTGEVRGQFTLTSLTTSPATASGTATATVSGVNPGQTLFTATLSGSNEVPGVSTPATGTATVLLSADQTTITVNQSFANLKALPTDSQFSVAPPGQNGPLALDLYSNHIELGPVPGATTGSFAPQTFKVGPTFVAQLVAGDIYTNIESYFSSTGEIRGNFTLTKSASVTTTAPLAQVPQLKATAKATGAHSVAVTGSFSDITAQAHTVLINWGDGHSNAIARSQAKSGSFQFAHRYGGNVATTYTITVTVEGANADVIATLVLTFTTKVV
jgi:hypothetical protein